MADQIRERQSPEGEQTIDFHCGYQSVGKSQGCGAELQKGRLGELQLTLEGTAGGPPVLLIQTGVIRVLRASTQGGQDRALQAS